MQKHSQMRTEKYGGSSISLDAHACVSARSSKERL